MMKGTTRSAMTAFSLCCAAVMAQSQAATTVPVAKGLTQPLYVTLPVPGGPVQLVQRAGLILSVQGGTVSKFLQISVGTASVRGLLDMVFDPDYTVFGALGERT